MQQGGKQVSQNVIKIGFQKTVTEVLKTSCKEIGKAVGLHVLKQSIETLVHNHLSKFCSDIGENLLSSFHHAAVFATGLQETLQIVYKTFGKKEAEKLVQDKIQKILCGVNGLVSDVKTIFTSITSSVSAGIGMALNKRSMTGNHLEIANIAHELLTYLKKIYDTFNFFTKIKDLLFGHITDFDTELRKTCSSKQVHENQISAQDIEAFQLKAVGDIKSALGQKAGQLIEEWTAQMLNKAAVCAIKVVSSEVKKMSMKQRENKEMQKLRQLIVKERERKLNEVLSGNTDAAALEPSNAHIEECMQIMKKTKSSKVFAELVREGVPMDRFCAQALEEAIPHVLSSFNAQKIKIRVETTDGEFVHETPFDDHDVQVITLKLERSADGNFGHYEGEECGGNKGGNNCMFEAATNELRKLNPNANIPDAATLREMTANMIESSPEVRHAIERGWHQYTLNRNMYGGAPQGMGEPAIGGLYKENKKYSELNKFEQDHQPASSHIQKYAKDEGIRNINNLDMPVMSLPKEYHQETLNYKGKANSNKNDHGIFHQLQKKYLSEGQYAEAIWHAVKANWIPIVMKETNADLRRKYANETMEHFTRWSEVKWIDKTNKTRKVITDKESKDLINRFKMKIGKDNLERMHNATFY